MDIEQILNEVKSGKINLGELSLTKLLGEFLDLCKQSGLDLEKESAALVCFSELLLLKSRRLLPVEKIPQAAQEELLPEEEFNYENYPLFKEAAQQLSQLWEVSQKSFPRTAFEGKEEIIFLEVSSADLQLAFYEVVERRAKGETCIVLKRPVIVFSRFLDLVWRIILKEKVFKFSDLGKKFSGKEELIVAFLAVLELAKRQKIKLLQESMQDDLVIEKRMEKSKE